MDPVGILLWLVIGGVAGWLAGKVMRGAGFGIVGNIIVGIVGAVLGGFVFGAIGISFAGIIGSLIGAFLGVIAAGIVFFETQLVKTLVYKFLPQPAFRNDVLACLTEIGSLDIGTIYESLTGELGAAYDTHFEALFTEVRIRPRARPRARGPTP